MSIRIHELAKKITTEVPIHLDNKDLLTMLKDRGFDVKSVSSTIDNISADALVQEFKDKYQKDLASGAVTPVAPAPEAAPAPAPAPAPVAAEPVLPTVKPAAEALPPPVAPKAPAPVVVPKPPVSAPTPPPPIASAPKPVSMPMPPPRPAAPAPVPAVSRPAPVPPPIASAPRPVPAIPVPPRPAGSAPAPAPLPPRPVSAPAPAPIASAPKPISAPPAAPALPPRSPAPAPAPVASAPRPLPATPTPSAVNQPVVIIQGDLKIIQLKPPVIVRDFAPALGLKPFKLISELMEMGIFASMNQTLDETVATKVAEKHGFLLEIKHRGDAATQQAAKEKEKEKKKPSEEDDTKNLAPRPPVVCILGHVDHGKTTLLDTIRKANVAQGEAGGITQHIGAYQITHGERRITFLDTPGHAAFTKMRSRGAGVTDIAVLVVAADDGFMPQTDEALKHAQNAKVSLLVAINKMDVKGANIDQVKSQMQQRGISPEDWGGEVITVPVSALKGTGITDLLEMILLQADVLELKANPKAEASGIIIESQVDVGRGPLATVLVQRGTLRVGDALVCGANFAKVRAMFDDKGNNIKEAGPATPVRVIGWSGTPDSGDTFKAVKNARDAEKMAEEEAQRLRKVVSTQAATPKEVSVESLFANIAATQQKVLKAIIKTDVFGSTEAVRHVLEGIKSNKVQLDIVSTEVGLVTKNDVLMASTGHAVILGFNTKLENGVTPLAKHHGVRIETFSIIYELADKVREMMADLLEPEQKEVKLGAAEVRATFPLAKGFVAGCLVTEGKVTRHASARIRRGKEIIYQGRVDTLKRFKDDANEVRAGLECGIKLDDYNGYQPGDLIECFEIQKVRASL